MARKPWGPTPVDSITHGDKRANIPTADAHTFVDPDIEAVRQVRYARDETLDPQLVWRGKYLDKPTNESQDELVVDAPPIYIQEKVDPRVLIENLRRTAERPEDEPELTLFDSFDGLDELDYVDFYRHDANWSNRMILGDSLQIMSSLAERERLRGKVQMIYFDPPYGIKFGSNWQPSVRKRTVKDGKIQDSTRDAEQIKAFRDTWTDGIQSYLTYLRDRLTAARELLTESGSCFIQMGDENYHLVRTVLDEVFGSENYCRTITFRKTTMQAGDLLPDTNDYLIWFARNKESVKFHQLYQSRSGSGWVNYDFARRADGRYERLRKDEKSDSEKLEPGSSIYRRSPLTSNRPPGSFPVTLNGRTYTPGNGFWKTGERGMELLELADRLEAYGSTLSYRRYTSDFPFYPLSNSWTDTASGGYGDDKIYVVQSNTKVVQRCMLMTTDPGDLVLDPTCGSGTTASVAEQWGRRWITIDTSRVALTLCRQRIMGAKFPWYLLSDSPEGFAKEQSLVAETLPRVKFTADIRQGFVLDRVQHITLKSIANNPDIKPGMSREAIDSAIKRHAEHELLFDRPYDDPKRVRVAGPFTVESLSPYRSLAFAGGPDPVDRESAAEAGAAQDAEGPRFEQTILDNLGKAGIQTGRKADRITFTSFEPYAGRYIQAVGERADETTEGAPSRVAVAIGPQYGTVSPRFVKDAAKEAIGAQDVDLLTILAFAFDAQVTGVTEADGVTVEAVEEGFANVAATRKLGRIPVLMVRMNADLLMGEELKKTGAGNLFTVFGEPDLEIVETDQGLVVHLHGVDVYDPTTGEVRSKNTSQIALWMIDTHYDGESFFVRHCYFTGGNDPYKRLKTALKADIDAEAWESLRRTSSRPFPKPDIGKIAVKVINDYGDEVMKVFEV